MDTKKKTTAKKATAKSTNTVKSTTKAAKSVKKAPSITLDTLTSKLWDVISAKDTSAVKDIVAIQFNVADMGTFFIAIKDGVPEITQDVYFDRNGTVETTTAEILKIAAGGYDFLAAAKSRSFNYYGDLAKAIELYEFLK